MYLIKNWSMRVISAYRYIFCYTVPVSTHKLLDIFLCYLANKRMDPESKHIVRCSDIQMTHN